MSDKPRVTRFQIDWTPLAAQQEALRLSAQLQAQQQAQQMAAAAFTGGVPQGMVPGGMPAPPLYGSGMLAGVELQQGVQPAQAGAYVGY